MTSYTASPDTSANYHSPVQEETEYETLLDK